MRSCHNGSGSNPHHSNAIKRHGWENVGILTMECPWYLLDKIEVFLIAFYELMDPKKGSQSVNFSSSDFHCAMRFVGTMIRVLPTWLDAITAIVNMVFPKPVSRHRIPPGASDDLSRFSIHFRHFCWYGYKMVSRIMLRSSFGQVVMVCSHGFI